MLGAFYSLGAVYARRLGMELSSVAIFMSTVIFGGVALQWPLGLLSDRFDRRRVIVIAFAGVLATGLGLALISAVGPLLLVLGALFGGLSFALYPLCVAHANDHLEPEQRVAASGRLVLAYSAGAATGPLTAASVMSVAGPGGLFLFIALCAGGALLFGAWRQIRALPIPPDQQQNYQVLPRTTPMSAALDPLAPEEPQEAS
jgi:MFS family permease